MSSGPVGTSTNVLVVEDEMVLRMRGLVRVADADKPTDRRFFGKPL